MQARTPIQVRRDTRAWRAQVWISFFLAAALCATGLAWLPGRDLDRAFMVMGYVFCLSTAFALAKFVRDNEGAARDTPLWSTVVWSGFALAMGLTAWGLWRMDINPTYKAYLGVSWLYLISSAFTLAKTLRDAFEADLEEARDEGRAEASRPAGSFGAPLRAGLCMLLAAWLSFAPVDDAHAHPHCCRQPSPSDASAISLLPVAISVAAPVAVISAGAALTVVAVDASAHGTVWVLERASDGTRASIELAGHASVGVGTVVVASVIGTGWVLSAAGQVIAFIPNEIGAALLYNERIGR